MDLTRIQRWMQAVIVHPGTEAAAVACSAAQAEVPLQRLPDVILPSRSLTPTERVGIYQRMYLLRMQEALSADYPALQHFLGDPSFIDLVEAYVGAHPSRSFSLNHLGDHLPEFLETYPRIPKRDFCVDLARLELAVTHVFDAEETPGLSAQAIAAVPAEAWERARLVPVTAFRLLALRFPANAYLQSVRDDHHDHPKVRRHGTFVAVYRRDYAVWRLDLSRSGHELLSDLAAGTPLGEAVTRAARRPGRPASEDELFRWFREWVSGGVFREVVLGS